MPSTAPTGEGLELAALSPEAHADPALAQLTRVPPASYAMCVPAGLGSEDPEKGTDLAEGPAAGLLAESTVRGVVRGFRGHRCGKNPQPLFIQERNRTVSQGRNARGVVCAGGSSMCGPELQWAPGVSRTGLPSEAGPAPRMLCSQVWWPHASPRGTEVGCFGFPGE